MLRPRRPENGNHKKKTPRGAPAAPGWRPISGAILGCLGGAEYLYLYRTGTRAPYWYHTCTGTVPVPYLCPYHNWCRTCAGATPVSHLYLAHTCTCTRACTCTAPVPVPHLYGICMYLYRILDILNMLITINIISIYSIHSRYPISSILMQKAAAEHTLSHGFLTFTCIGLIALALLYPIHSMH